MEAPVLERPWEELQHLLEQGDPQPVQEFLGNLPSGDAALALDRLEQDQRRQAFALLAPDHAAALIDQLSDVQALDVMEDLDPHLAAAIVQELPSDEQADLLGHLSNPEAVLTEMQPDVADEARTLAQYPDDVAGGLMITEYLAYPEDVTVADVLQDLQDNAEEYGDYDVQYAYVTDTADRLVGVLQLRDLVLARRAATLALIALRDPITLPDTATLDQIEETFDRYPFFGIPVTDAAGVLVGIVQRAALQEALAGRSENDYRNSQGIVGGDELRTMPLLLRSRRRLAWLSVNIVLNIIAASVIAAYQDTLATVIALAVFLPIISDMSGCSGNQAVAVSMRELTMGVLRPGEFVRVWLKEISVGLINGVVLGLLLAAAAWAWKGNPYLGLVVGGAMALNTMVAVSIGGTVPLLLRRFNMDPALASGPILTTVTDMCGFFLVLSIAASMLPLLA